MPWRAKTLTQYRAMQAETGDSLEDDCSGNLGNRFDQCHHFEPGFDGNLFGGDAEHSDTDYGFEQVGETILQGRSDPDLMGGTSEPGNFDVTDSPNSFELLRSAVTASADSNRSDRRGLPMLSNWALHRSPEAQFWTMTIFHKCCTMFSLEMPKPCQWSCLGRKELQRQFFPKGATASRFRNSS